MKKSTFAIRLAGGILGAAGCAGAALAADMPVKAPILAPAVYNWTASTAAFTPVTAPA